MSKSSRPQGGSKAGRAKVDQVRQAQRAKERRSRIILVTAVATLVVLTLVAAKSGLLPAFGAVQPVSVVVQHGQTLSEIAAVHLPGLPVGQGVVEIQLANSLNSLQVQAGQVLQIPAP